MYWSQSRYWLLLSFLMIASRCDLPGIATDKSELFLNAVIEDPFDRPTLVMFLLSQRYLRLDLSLGQIYTEIYYANGLRRRSVDAFDCHTRFSVYPWTHAPASFIPTMASPDSNAGGIDILRCPLSAEYAASNLSELEVVIRRRSQKEEKTLISWVFPQSTRLVGILRYLHASPSSADIHPYDFENTVYLAVGGLELKSPRRSIRVLAETIVHHLRVGINHVMVSTSHSLVSDVVARIIDAFQSYIHDGKLSIFTYSHEDISPEVRRVLASHPHPRDLHNLLFDNVCLYLCKGLAAQLGVWDLDEMLIPHVGETIQDILRSYPPTRLSSSCGLVFSSAVLFRNSRPCGGCIWAAEVFNSSETRGPAARTLDYKKSLVNVRNVFHLGLHLPGACKLPLELTSCYKGVSLPRGGFCHSESEREVSRRAYLDKCKVNDNIHDFDDMTCINFSIQVFPTTAEIYHIQIHRPHLRPGSSMTSASVSNEYSQRFFNSSSLAHFNAVAKIITNP